MGWDGLDGLDGLAMGCTDEGWSPFPNKYGVMMQVSKALDKVRGWS